MAEGRGVGAKLGPSPCLSFPLRALPELTPCRSVAVGVLRLFLADRLCARNDPTRNALRYPGCSPSISHPRLYADASEVEGGVWLGTGPGQRSGASSTSAHLRCYMNKQNLCVITSPGNAPQG